MSTARCWSTWPPTDPLTCYPAGTPTPLAGWLREHPGIEVICRDRSGAYAEGARAGAAAAVQVADRWHLWHNLAEAVEKTVIAHRHDLAEPEPEPEAAAADPPAPPTTTASAPVESRLVTRDPGTVRSGAAAARRRHVDLRDLPCPAAGSQDRAARAETVDELLAKARNRGSVLDRFKPYLHERFNAGSPTPPASPK